MPSVSPVKKPRSLRVAKNFLNRAWSAGAPEIGEDSPAPAAADGGAPPAAAVVDFAGELGPGVAEPEST